MNYSRLLDLLQNQMNALQAEEDANLLQMHDIMRYMINYPDVFHHPYEEMLFQQLRARGVPPAAAGLVEKVEKEHAELAEQGKSLADRLHAAISGSVVSRQELIEHADSYTRQLRDHIRLEERDVFPLIDSTLQAADWTALEPKIRNVEDPIFGPSVAEEFQRLYDSVLMSGE